MRIPIMTAALGLALALGACSQSEQHKTTADTQAVAQDVKSNAEQAGADVKTDVKKVASDKDVKKAERELKTALKDLGASVKKAAHKNKHGSEEAGNSAAEDKG